MREGLARSTAGLMLGLALASAATRMLETMLTGVRHLDLPTYSIAAVVLTVAMLSASVFPARRAARVDPATTLRED